MQVGFPFPRRAFSFILLDGSCMVQGLKGFRVRGVEVVAVLQLTGECVLFWSFSCMAFGVGGLPHASLLPLAATVD